MKLRKILPIIGLIFFVYLIYRIGLDKILITVKNANQIYLLLGIISTPIFLLPLIIKWRKILKYQGFILDFLYVQRVYYIGAFYGLITPARSGSIMRAYYIKNKTKRSIIDCVSSIIVERIIDLFVIFFFAFIGSLIVLNKFNSSLSWTLIIAFILFCLSLLILMNKRVTTYILKFFYNMILPEKIKEKADSSLNKFYDSIPKFKQLVVIFLMTIVTWVIIYFQSFIFAKAFYIEIPFHIFITFMSMGTVIATLPISISGLGTREAALITLFSLYGVRPEAIVSTSLISFLVVGVLEGLVGLFFIHKEGKNEILDYNTISS